jgi:hypothetical protein
MTKRTLLTTASAAVLAMVIASPVMAGPNDFANKGDGKVGILNLTLGGSGGSGGAGGNPSDVGTSGGNGGNGANGGVGGVIINNVNANSGNTYKRTEVNVHASNHQTARSGGKIDTSGGRNYQSGGSANASGSATAGALNVNFTDVSGGNARGDSASANNDANTTARGGFVVDVGSGNASGDASAHADGTSTTQDGTAVSGATTGGNGGSGGEGGEGGSSNDNTTLGGESLAAANGGNTSGPQNANGGNVDSGVMTVDGMANAAGAFAMNSATGAFGVGNSANAVAARVNSITTN